MNVPAIDLLESSETATDRPSHKSLERTFNLLLIPRVAVDRVNDLAGWDIVDFGHDDRLESKSDQQE